LGKKYDSLLEFSFGCKIVELEFSCVKVAIMAISIAASEQGSLLGLRVTTLLPLQKGDMIPWN